MKRILYGKKEVGRKIGKIKTGYKTRFRKSLPVYSLSLIHIFPWFMVSGDGPIDRNVITPLSDMEKIFEKVSTFVVMGRRNIATHSDIPVSYTHLDVYKRQGIGRKVDKSQCISVRLCFCQLGPAYFTVSTRFIFNNESLSDIFFDTACKLSLIHILSLMWT